MCSPESVGSIRAACARAHALHDSRFLHMGSGGGVVRATNGVHVGSDLTRLLQRLCPSPIGASTERAEGSFNRPTCSRRMPISRYAARPFRLGVPVRGEQSAQHDYLRSDASNVSGDARAPDLLPCRKLPRPDRIPREIALVKSQQFGLHDLTKSCQVVLFEMCRRP